MINKIKKIYRNYLIKKQPNVYISNDVVFELTASISSRYGKIVIGKGSCIAGRLEIQRPSGVIKIGDNSYIGEHSRIWSAKDITIGNNVLIAHNVNIFDNNTHPLDVQERREDFYNNIKGIRKDYSSLIKDKVTIENDVWIGCNSIILKGVTIGEASIVAAGSVVTKSFPSHVVVAGNPAKIVKKL